MASHDVIVIGASAGGVEALRTLLPLLPPSPPLAVFVAIHRPKSAAMPSATFDWDWLVSSLDRASRVRVVLTQDRQRIEFGVTYFSPPGSHLVVERGVVRVRENATPEMSKHAVDALFRSAARSYKQRVVGIVLTGMLNDGTAGFWDIRRHGGITIVQDPSEASYPSMPRQAMEDVPVHYCLPLTEIASKLIQLATDPSASPTPSSTPRVLITEDERLIAMNLEKRLTALGYKVVGSVSSGEEALNSVARTSPDIVLMDIHLAGKMTGTEAGRIMWEQFGIPIVYLTAYSDQETVNSAKPSMPYAYIVKPYRPAEIHSAIQLALDRRERELKSTG